MPRLSQEKSDARRAEIIDACEALYQSESYHDITMSQVASGVTFGRANIYNYFQCKDEILLALLQREHDKWTARLDELANDAENLDDERVADGLAQSLAERKQMLKLLAMNLYDMEQNSRLEKLVEFKRSYAHAVEALLLGTSGLLDLYPHDTYTLDLKRTFVYLAAKYEITAMEAGAWQLANIRPANHPVLRIAQAAEFFSQDEFIMERAMACRSEEDIRQLFCVEASPYWRTHHTPGAERDESPKRIGRFKANIIGINLVCVLQFAYGSRTGREALRDSALTLLERLPAEENRYMRLWAAAGAAPRNAFESQALLQLATEYCAAERCAECPVGRRILQKIADGRA